MLDYALPLLDGNTLMLDNSSLESLTTCPRSAQYSVIRRKRSNTVRSALNFGGIMHRCLEHRYRAAQPLYGQTDEVTNEMIAIASKGFASTPPPEDDYRNFDRMVDLIHNYGKTYPFEDFKLITFPDGKPFIEVPFSIPLGELEVDTVLWTRDVATNHIERRHIPSINISWMGKIDLGYDLNGATFIMDHKSASMQTNMDEFVISHQFYGYAWATEQIIKRPVNGIIVNRVVVRKPTRTGTPFTFERKYIPVSRDLLHEWRNDCLHIIADFVEQARREYFQKHTGWCVGKFGTCPFHKVCTLDPGPQREVMLNSGEFVDNQWSPLHE